MRAEGRKRRLTFDRLLILAIILYLVGGALPLAALFSTEDEDAGWHEPTWDEQAAMKGAHCVPGPFAYDVNGPWGAKCKYDI